MNPKPNRRRIELKLPLAVKSTITRRRFLEGAGVLLAAPSVLAAGVGTTADRGVTQPANTTRVHFRLMDKVTPAMACIVDPKSKEVRLPPDGGSAPSLRRFKNSIPGFGLTPRCFCPHFGGPSQCRCRLARGSHFESQRRYEIMVVKQTQPALPEKRIRYNVGSRQLGRIEIPSI